jgi:hypothetical protein
MCVWVSLAWATYICMGLRKSGVSMKNDFCKMSLKGQLNQILDCVLGPD